MDASVDKPDASSLDLNRREKPHLLPIDTSPEFVIRTPDRGDLGALESMHDLHIERP